MIVFYASLLFLFTACELLYPPVFYEKIVQNKNGNNPPAADI
jgi:hypothetical protein